MLTKKQRWRRVRACNQLVFFPTFVSSLIPSSVSQIKSFPHQHCRDEDVNRDPDKDSLCIARESSINRISFNQITRVVLVPSREDYHYFGVHTELWWQPLEYLDFKQEATAEVTAVMKQRDVDIKRAIQILYQTHPHFHSDEPLEHLDLSIGSPTTVSDPSPLEAVNPISISAFSNHQSLGPRE
jgi:hypothetical protein